MVPKRDFCHYRLDNTLVLDVLDSFMKEAR